MISKGPKRAYLVTFKRPDAGSPPPRRRSEQVALGTAFTETAIRDARRALVEAGFDEDDVQFGAAMVVPMASLRCPPEAADQLRELAMVEDVMEDEPGFELLR